MHYRRWRKAGSTEARQRPTVEQRFWSKVNKNGPIPQHRPDLGPCWMWTRGKFSDGYGAFSVVHDTQSKAHRIAYEWAHGPIPDDLVPDHQCHDTSSCPGGDTCPHRACVNPAHLKLVIPRENTLRRVINSPAAAKTHCNNGHRFDEENTYRSPVTGYRACKECTRQAGRRRDARVRAQRQTVTVECGAPAKRGFCTRVAGEGTAHRGSGNCRYHDKPQV